MEPLTQKQRIVALIINVLIAWFIYFLSTHSFFPTGSGSSIWLLSVIAYWLLVLVATPFPFSPPKDSLSIAISVILLLVPLDFSNVIHFNKSLTVLNYITISLSIFIVFTALFSIFSRKSKYERLNEVCYRLSNSLGKGEVLLTLTVIISVLGFYQSDIKWIFIISGFWVFTVVARPVELFFKLYLFLKGYKKLDKDTELVGTIIRIDDPNIIRVNLSGGSSFWKAENIHIAHLPDNEITYVLPLFVQVKHNEVIGTGLCCPIPSEIVMPIKEIGTVHSYKDSGLALQLGCVLSGTEKEVKIAGIVVEGSSISNIRFQVIPNVFLEEGKVVYALIRGKKVYYQILDASTKEEQFQQNPFGIQIVYASQLGFYDSENGFKKFAWLPEMNQPLFLVSKDEKPEQVLSDNEFIVGKVPSTSFGIPVILDDLIEYHTAILGKTGTAKTELAFDIIREALKRNTKVFCVDFTGEYKARLKKDCNPQLIEIEKDDQRQLETLLFAIDAKGFKADTEQIQMKKLLEEKIKPTIIKKIEDFLKNNESSLGIFELAEITNTRTTLRITELYLSAIMNWARDNRKKRKIFIVLEEAHTIIPETSGSFDANTKWVVERIGQIALQGRKYGVGLMLISQRTALISKTVLSQCHTYFIHELIDKTSLDYLSGILSIDHVKAIPNLRFLKLIAYGKGVKSEHPILLEREYDKNKKKDSEALNIKDEVIISKEEEIDIDTPDSK